MKKVINFRCLAITLFYYASTTTLAEAAICFLPDCNEELEAFSGDGNKESQFCRNDGYTLYESGKCPNYHFQETCPYSDKFLKCDAAKWCDLNNYTLTSCNLPSYLDEPCPNGLQVYKKCTIDYNRACKSENTNYTNSCPSGWKVDPNNHCSYTASYGICCNMCNDYPYTANSIPAGYTKGASCTACGGIVKYKASCSYRYQSSDCASNCQYTGSSSCVIGGTTYYSSCGSSKCSSGQRCVSGSCSCDSSYAYSCSGNGYAGGSGSSCNGRYTACSCANGYSWNGSSCVASGFESYWYICCDRNHTRDYSFCKNYADECSNERQNCYNKGGTNFYYDGHIAFGGSYNGYTKFVCQ